MPESFEQDVIDRLARIETNLAGLPDRVRALERFKAWALGSAGVISFVTAVAADILFHHRGV